MQRSDLRWDDVRFFLALTRATTVGEAGAALGVDGSTVSRRLAALEEVLGATLFARGREGIAPTKAAEDLLPAAEEMEHVMHRFAHAADGLEREVSGVVRVTCPPDVAEVFLVPILPALFARHPGLRIAIDASEQVLDLGRREADLALRVLRPERGDLVITRLLSVRWVAAAAPALAARLGKVRAWDELPWIGWGEGLAHVPAARWLAKHGPTDVLARSDSLRVQLALAAAGVGVTLVPAPSVAHFGLVPIALAPRLRADAETWPVDELFLVTHRALRDVPRVRAVWDLIRESATSRRAR